MKHTSLLQVMIFSAKALARISMVIGGKQKKTQKKNNETLLTLQLELSNPKLFFGSFNVLIAMCEKTLSVCSFLNIFSLKYR